MATVEHQRMMKSYESREQLRAEYERDKMKEVTINANKRDVYSKEDMLNLPRHRVNCNMFRECLIDYKCRAYDPKYIQCKNCELHKSDGICHKQHIHTEKAHAMMISRERIDLDGKEE